MDKPDLGVIGLLKKVHQLPENREISKQAFKNLDKSRLKTLPKLSPFDKVFYSNQFIKEFNKVKNKDDETEPERLREFLRNRNNNLDNFSDEVADTVKTPTVFSPRILS